MPLDREDVFCCGPQSQLPASQWSMYDGAPVGEGRGESWDRKLNGGDKGIWP